MIVAFIVRKRQLRHNILELPAICCKRFRVKLFTKWHISAWCSARFYRIVASVCKKRSCQQRILEMFRRLQTCGIAHLFTQPNLIDQFTDLISQNQPVLWAARWPDLCPIHTADADATKLLSRRRRRCEHNSQLAHDDCRRIRSTIWKLTKQTP